ncbi:hypothetical protein CMO93_05635 [Candidatus Woesearchaeota archaeon]|nr:hypothetical protein [Candidatus Woesearchaeota archaeon]|tara:strand:+ start:118 stop:678 length:561 start_codon:yes stop_codon:yes gene_type:complete
MSKIKIVILGISIAIILAFFFGYGINTFYKPPEHKDYCKEGEFYPRAEFYQKPIVDESEKCEYIEPDESLRLECTEKEGQITPKRDENGCIESYYCEMCYKEFDNIREIYNRNVFIISAILGIISLLIGAFLKLPSVSSGIMGGGILTIIYGTLRYWGNMPDYGRFTILGIALAILIWLGYKKFKK